jgi:hypothetical protein
MPAIRKILRRAKARRPFVWTDLSDDHPMTAAVRRALEADRKVMIRSLETVLADLHAVEVDRAVTHRAGRPCQ